MVLARANSVAIQQNKRPDYCGNCLNVILSLVIIVWMMTMVTHYGTSFPSSLWTGRHLEMNASCSSLFNVVHWSAFFTLCIVVLEASMVAVLLVPEMRLLCAPCLVCCGCLDLIGCVGKLVVSIWGLIVVLFMVQRSECSECHDLHLCAWCCFVGLLLMQLVFLCCNCGYQMLKHEINRDGVDRSLKKGGEDYGSVVLPTAAYDSSKTASSDSEMPIRGNVLPAHAVPREQLISEGRLYQAHQ